MWMYNKKLKRDVFCSKIDSFHILCYEVEHWKHPMFYDVTFFDGETKKWCLENLGNFEPPKEVH